MNKDNLPHGMDSDNIPESDRSLHVNRFMKNYGIPACDLDNPEATALYNQYLYRPKHDYLIEYSMDKGKTWNMAARFSEGGDGNRFSNQPMDDSFALKELERYRNHHLQNRNSLTTHVRLVIEVEVGHEKR